MLAWCSPFVVMVAFMIHVLNFGASRNLLAAAAVMCGTSAYMGRFMHRRSRGQEGKFVTMRIGPDDDETTQWLGDSASVVSAVALAVTAVVFPFI